MNTNSIFEIIKDSGFQIAAVCICISCLYFSLARYYYGKLHNKIFLAIMVNILLSAICDIGNTFSAAFGDVSAAARTAHEVNLYFYFVLHALLSPLFCFYMTIVTGISYRLNRKLRYLYEFPLYISELLVLLNPLTGWVYKFDENHRFVRLAGENVIYVISVAYFAVAAILVLVLWRAIDEKKKKTIAYFFAIVAVGTAIQFFFQGMQTELFAEALAMTGVMITLENEEGRKDTRTGIYNIQAFVTDINVLFAAGHPFCIICIKMANPQNLMQMVGQTNIEQLTIMTAEYLSALVPKHSIYYTNPGTFLILYDSDDQNSSLEIARTIYERFRREWNFQDRESVFAAAVFCAQIPKDFQTMEEIMALILSPMSAAADKKEDVYFGNDLNYFLRRTQVEKAILSGLSSRSFDVYYQPIYDAKDLSIRSGEALLRLHDAELGEIYPDEFLPVAERNGLIFELGDFVLDEVCKFLNSGIPVEMGIESLNINLSVIQCIQPSYAERILQMVSRYDIDPKRITFEIVESAATTNYEGLAAFVSLLSAQGFRFSVDDYGIGYSNVHSIFSLDVDMIKIDRTILWEAEQTQIGRIIMESSVDMIKRMGKKILISGVESKAQIDLSSEFGVDYLQGFFFSNPVSQNEFIGILKATQLARMEEQRALAASEAMSNFLANMSHEIRTPINAVLGMDEMILRESGDDKILEYARNIKGAGRTLLSLINDILDFSKIEAGNMDIVEIEYDLSSVLGDVINMIEVKAQQKGLELHIEVDPTTPEPLYGDEMRIRQILLNILGNAIKYTKSGTVTLKVSYERVGKERIKLIMAVSDTGIGIREEDIGRLFGKFQRLDQKHNNTIEGSGLGLAITHQLLELMNGKIDVESTYGEGSTFTVTLPQRVIRNEEIGDFRRKFSISNESAPKYRESFSAPDARILVVDDTPMNLVVVRELLKKLLLVVDVAQSGEECLQMVTKQKYDLIFLDYRMPVMDGIETLRRLSQLPDNQNTETPVVALTANAISGARERFIKEGFDDYMTKPIDAVKLEELLLMYIPDDKIQLKTDGAEHREAKKDGAKREKAGRKTEKPNGVKREKAEPDEGKREEAKPDTSGREEAEPGDVKRDVAGIPGLDMEKGIRNCGSKETFLTVFAAFRNDIRERVDVIRDAFDRKDWKRYAIEVHAIKSSAAIIGAAALSKLAMELELAAESEDTGRIEEDHEKLLVMYERYRFAGPETDEPEKGGGQHKPYMTQAMWIDALKTLHEFAQSMDMDNALLVLDSMEEYRIPAEKADKKKEIKTFVSQLRWDEMTRMIDEMLREEGA